MEMGFVGLGKMGMSMVTRLTQNDHDVIVYNRSKDKIKSAEKIGAKGSSSLKNLIDQLSSPRIIWLMLPAGKVTQEHIMQLADLLKKNDIVIDGGNAFYQDSINRASILKAKGIHFLDIGVSGGIWGLKQGYCLMVGGERKTFNQVKPLLKTLAPDKGYAYIGKNGSGHFVKMVHNGIEYAMLQAYGEGFEIIHAKKEFNIDLQKLANLWDQGSVIRSWLLTLVGEAFKDNATLQGIEGYVEDSGEGRWTVAEAINEDVPAPVITLALLQRLQSRQKESFSAKIIAALRNKFGGHQIKLLKKKKKQ